MDYLARVLSIQFFCGNSCKSVTGTLAKRVNLPAIFLVNSSDS